MKKTLHIIKNVLVWLVVAIAVGMMIFTVVSVNTFDRTDRSLFGYKAFIVLSDSMSATDFNAGDVVLVKEVDDPSTLKAGDIISYQSINNENYGEIVTHKIRKLASDEDGNPGFVTYGTTTGKDDENIVTYSYVLGKYKSRLPGVGKFFEFLKTPPGYIICIFLPFLLLILVQGINSIRLFKQYKREQLSEIEAQREEERTRIAEERERLEKERAESQKMMAELLQLKKELSGKETDNENTVQPQQEPPDETETEDPFA